MRGKSMQDMAKALGVGHRTYEDFEAGRGRLNIERILAFAAVTDSDAMAILIAAIHDAPDLALRSANNRLTTINLLGLAAFAQRERGLAGRLASADLIAFFEAVYADLAASAADGEQSTRAWLDRGGRPT